MLFIFEKTLQIRNNIFHMIYSGTDPKSLPATRNIFIYFVVTFSLNIFRTKLSIKERDNTVS